MVLQWGRLVTGPFAFGNLSGVLVKPARWTMVELTAVEFLADPQAFFVGLSAASEVIGFSSADVSRMVYALAVNGYAIRYQDFPSGDNSLFGISFENVFPCDTQIVSASLVALTNVAVPLPSKDFAIGPVNVQGRIVYAMMSGGIAGTDYQLRWTATGTDGSIATRTALVLCTQTS